MHFKPVPQKKTCVKLGLKNKKDYVSKIISEHKLDIVCLQETEIEQSYPLNILSIKTSTPTMTK